MLYTGQKLDHICDIVSMQAPMNSEHWRTCYRELSRMRNAYEARIAELEVTIAKKDELINAKAYNVIKLLYEGDEPED